MHITDLEDEFERLRSDLLASLPIPKPQENRSSEEYDALMLGEQNKVATPLLKDFSKYDHSSSSRYCHIAYILY